MDRRIVQRNVEHFRLLLASESDPDKREIFRRLLAEQEAKLRELGKREGKKT
jgi:hypothetical protein